MHGWYQELHEEAWACGQSRGDDESTVLTDITQYDPMYVYFNINERDLLRVLGIFRRRVAEKGIDLAKETQARTEIVLDLGLANEDGFPHQGYIDFSESGLDASTGTARLRGAFANAGRPPTLYPGLFARVRMPIDTRPDMPLVTDRG